MPNMSALTFWFSPCASSSRDSSMKTWSATWARGARSPPLVASSATRTTVWRTMAPISKVTFTLARLTPGFAPEEPTEMSGDRRRPASGEAGDEREIPHFLAGPQVWRRQSVLRAMAKKSAALGAARPAAKITDLLVEELWFGDEEPADVKDRAARSLSAKLAELRGMKPFPVVAERVMTLVADQRARLEDVARVLE